MGLKEAYSTLKRKVFKNFLHRQTVAKINYYKTFYPLGITFEEYCAFLDGKIVNSDQLTYAKLYDVKVKRIHALSFVHSVEEVFIQETYKFESHKAEPVIIDCGANIGLSVIYFKRLFPNSKIIAFEPDFNIYDACKENLNAFGFTDVELINAAVWKTDGELSFISDNSLGGMVVENADKGETVKKVVSVDLKRFIKTDIDFLKIDIEGAELEVLLDCKDLLNNVQNLFVEYHSSVNMPQQLHSLLEIMTNAGFRYYIKPAWDFMDNPFIENKITKSLTYDLQLNIFAYRS